MIVVLRLLVIAALGLSVAPAVASEGGGALPSQSWSFSGMFGSFDRATLRRGLEVYRGVCANCHSLKYVAFRSLIDIGLGEDEATAIASEYEVTDGPDDEGDMFDREARLSDRFPPPFPNDNAARAANGGALPPDLSLITKSRFKGPDYVFAILTGYEQKQPAEIEIPDGMHYNPYFHGGLIGMPQPLYGDDVEFDDGTEATVAQMAEDVVIFLHWAAEPSLEARKSIGLKAFLFLLVLTALLLASKRQIWSRLH